MPLPPFALTLRLLPALRRGPAARVVNVTSISYVIGRLRLGDLTFKRFYWPLGSYLRRQAQEHLLHA
ncbi:MAG: hypothetical protein IPH72_24405 [Sandaracinaceae bacterium]|nr:hypothetical protein [Sandaracinaceae bacterium]